MNKKIPKDNWCNRSRDHENVYINEKNNFRYLMRGVERTPAGTEVFINKCNMGIASSYGILKNSANYSLINKDGYYSGQCIAFSRDLDDLYLFAVEHGWIIEGDEFEKYKQFFETIEDLPQ